MATTRTEHPISRGIVGIVIAGSVTVASVTVAWASATAPAPHHAAGPTAADLRRAARIRQQIDAVRAAQHRAGVERRHAHALARRLERLHRRTERISLSPTRPVTGAAVGSGTTTTGGSRSGTTSHAPAQPSRPAPSAPKSSPAPPVTQTPPPVNGSTGASGG